MCLGKCWHRRRGRKLLGRSRSREIESATRLGLGASGVMVELLGCLDNGVWTGRRGVCRREGTAWGEVGGASICLDGAERLLTAVVRSLVLLG